MSELTGLRRELKDITSGMYYELKDGELTFDEAENRVVDACLSVIERIGEEAIGSPEYFTPDVSSITLSPETIRNQLKMTQRTRLKALLKGGRS